MSYLNNLFVVKIYLQKDISFGHTYATVVAATAITFTLLRLQAAHLLQHRRLSMDHSFESVWVFVFFAFKARLLPYHIDEKSRSCATLIHTADFRG